MKHTDHTEKSGSRLSDHSLGLARAQEDFEEIGGFSPEDSKALAQELIGALGEMAEVEITHGRARLEIVQWREFGDDEDSLSLEVFEAGSSADVIQCIADEHELMYDPAGERPDQKGYMLTTNTLTIYDGEVMQCSGGRKFRINITEVKE